MKVRKLLTIVEESRLELGRVVDPPIRTAIAAAVIANPWAGHGFVDDLMPEVGRLAPELGELLASRVVEVLGGGKEIQAYGKSALVGLGGEIEHASALIHTLRFGNVFRELAEGTSYLSFTNTRGTAGSTIMIPMVHKMESWRRSHFTTAVFSVADAPADDELVVALSAATAGRPFERIGDRNQDLALMGLEEESVRSHGN